MSDGGKGSAPRPFSIAHDEYTKRWDAIFRRDLQEEEKKPSDYQDVLSTEDCVLNSLDNQSK